MLSNTTPDFIGLINRYGGNLSMLLKQRDELEFSPDRAVMEFLKIDTSVDKSNIDWIIQHYIAGDYSFRGAHKAKNIFLLLSVYSEKLVKKHINQYTDMSELLEAINTLGPNLKKDATYLKHLCFEKLTEQMQYSQAFFESKIIVDTPDCFIATPLTHFAECWYGQNTLWPWAYNIDKREMFSQKDPTFYIELKTQYGKKKMFLSVSDNRVLFLDEYHKKASLRMVDEFWPYLEPLIIHCNKNGNLMEYFPEHCRTLEYVKPFAEKNAEYFKYLKDQDITEDLCGKAFQADVRALKFIPKKFITQDMYDVAVRKQGTLLRYVPTELIDYDMCESAVSQFGKAIGFVPEKLRCKKLYEIAQHNYPEAILITPPEFIDEEMYKIALQERIINLSDIPLEMRTRDVCLEAFVSTDVDIDLISGVADYEFYEQAVTVNPRVLKFIPEDFKTTAVYCLASQDIYNFPHLPKNQQASMQIEAVKYNSWNFQYIDNNDKTREMCFEASKEPGFNLANIPSRLQDSSICVNAIQGNGQNLRYVKDNILSQKMCRSAVNQDGHCLKYVPNSMIDHDMVLDAYRQNALNIRFAPLKLVQDVKKAFEKTRFKNSLDTMEWDLKSLDKLEETYWDFFQTNTISPI